MQFVHALWMPVVLSSVAVFIASCLMHMLLPIHRNDFRGLPNEDKVLASLRSLGVGPGAYMFPHCNSMKEMGSPEMKAKIAQGPVGTIVLRGSDGIAIGKSMLQWFVFTLVVSALVGAAAWSVLRPGADIHAVFHLALLTSFLGYGFTNVTDSIWKGIAWSVTIKFLVDGLIYGLATAAVFAWLWPAAIA
jgi:hypothetical protein